MRNKKILAFIISTALSLGVAASVVDAASWGHGQITASSNQTRKVKVQDKKTDGHCVRVRYTTANGGSNTWFDTGICHGSFYASTYTFQANSTITAVRIYRGYSGWYQTIEW